MHVLLSMDALGLALIVQLPLPLRALARAVPMSLASVPRLPLGLVLEARTALVALLCRGVLGLEAHVI